MLVSWWDDFRSKVKLSGKLATNSDALAPSSFLFLVAIQFFLVRCKGTQSMMVHIPRYNHHPLQDQ